MIILFLLSSEMKAYIAEFLVSPDSFFAALHLLQRRYGQPQLLDSGIFRHYVISLEYDPAGLANLSRAVFGAINVLSDSGYEQYLEPGINLETVVDKLPHRLQSS